MFFTPRAPKSRRTWRVLAARHVAGLTNLLNEVQRPHTIDAARNLPTPQLLPRSLSPQKLAVLFMPSPYHLQGLLLSRMLLDYAAEMFMKHAV